MRNPLSKTITTIQPSGIRKFFDIVHEMKDAISLGVGEPDFDTPWHIRDEGIYSLEKGRTFYTSNAGLKELKIEIDKYLKRRFGVSYDYNNEIMVTVGGSEAIDIAMRAMLKSPMKEKVIPNKCIKAKAMNASIVPAVAQVFSFATFITINTTIRPIKYPTAVIPRNCKSSVFRTLH